MDALKAGAFSHNIVSKIVMKPVNQTIISSYDANTWHSVTSFDESYLCGCLC
jgi:hypothetical protein